MEDPESPIMSHETEVLVQTVAQIRIDGTKAKPNDFKSQAKSTEFVSVLNSKIQELEARGPAPSSTAERDSVKTRRKTLKELQKYVLDKTISLEDKIAFVQTKYTSQVRHADVYLMPAYAYQ